ncbi:MAG: GNAT family N-acetyltransferase [Nitriliruptoraceae bacterium]
MDTHAHVLPDGTTVTLRAIRPDDDERLLAMWDRTSPESRRRRFLGPFTLDHDSVQRFTRLEPGQQFAVVASRGRGEGERIIGVAQWDRDPDHPSRAEFAALVEDAEQGRGVGTALVREVARAGAEAGITHLRGDVLVDNVRMLNLIREVGLEYQSQGEGAGVLQSDLDVTATPRFLDVVDESERRAATAALRRFLRPERIAVVGASRNPRAIGGTVFANLLRGGFSGVVYPVNPNATHVQTVAAYPDLTACPQVPDLVIVCVPAPLVADVVDEAGRLGVAAVCVVTAGFAEVDGGRTHQDELLALARGHGLRLVGPNCMGLLNGADDVRMNATFSATFPASGRISMSSQSGALGLAVLRHVDRLGLGMSTFVSVGNKADISGNDLLLYWEEDPDTDVVLMYLESFGNPRRFSRIARRVSRTKPIVAVKSGRSGAGVRAASSHTAAMSSGDEAVQALFDQTGVIRTDTLEEMFDVATLLSSQPLPVGRNVAILSNAGGPAILAADALEAHGLEVPHLSDRTLDELRTFLPAEAGITNPVDMIASASAGQYARALRVLAEADEVDVVFVIFIPTGSIDTEGVASALAHTCADLPDDLVVVAVFMSADDAPRELTEAGVPVFSFPETAARALGRVNRYAAWRRRPLGEVVEPVGIDRDAARHAVDAFVTQQADGATDGGWADHGTATRILSAYGIPFAMSEVVTSATEGARAFERIGGPVAVKLAAAVHKADVGGVELSLTSADAVAGSIERMVTRLHDQGLDHLAEAFVVQRMVPDGVEMVVGVTHDPSFGPVVVTGMGGTLVELIRDVSLRVTPLTDHDVHDMLDELRMRPLLNGYRGAPPADTDALIDLLHRVNALVEDVPEITELDLNPVFVGSRSSGAMAVDVRMQLTGTPR